MSLMGVSYLGIDRVIEESGDRRVKRVIASTKLKANDNFAPVEMALAA